MVHSYSKLLIFTLGLKWSLWAQGIHPRGNEWCILIFRLAIVLLTHLLATIQVLISLNWNDLLICGWTDQSRGASVPICYCAKWDAYCFENTKHGSSPAVDSKPGASRHCKVSPMIRGYALFKSYDFLLTWKEKIIVNTCKL